jgi:hypothetical protein
MTLDRTVVQLFQSIELAKGRKAVERMLLETVAPGADPTAVHELALLARTYLLEQYRSKPIMVDGVVIDHQGMDRFQASRSEQPARVNSPFLDDLRPTTKVREPLGRERNKYVSPRARKAQAHARESEAQGKQPYTLEGVTYYLKPEIISMLQKALKKDG